MLLKTALKHNGSGSLMHFNYVLFNLHNQFTELDFPDKKFVPCGDRQANFVFKSPIHENPNESVSKDVVRLYSRAMNWICGRFLYSFCIILEQL